MTQAEVRRMFIKANPGVKRVGKKGLWYRCAHCGKWCGRAGSDKYIKLNSDEIMEVDHIRPWQAGGSDALYNLQPLCRPCNRIKSSKPTFGDNLKILKNDIVHGDILTAGIKKAARQNKVLKGLGITSRK